MTHSVSIAARIRFSITLDTEGTKGTKGTKEQARIFLVCVLLRALRGLCGLCVQCPNVYYISLKTLMLMQVNIDEYNMEYNCYEAEVPSCSRG